jgi:hypothetical protein
MYLICLCGVIDDKQKENKFPINNLRFTKN